MKKEYRDLYLKAVVKEADRLTKGKTLPVAVDAFKLFDRACMKAGLPHPYSRNESRKIVLSFADEIFRRCYAASIVTMKIPHRIMGKVAHGKQCVIDEERNAEWYASQATMTRGNEAVAFILFGPLCTEIHPLLYGDLERSGKRVVNTKCNHERRLQMLVDSNHVSSNVAKALTNGSNDTAQAITA